jgi:hypothetical protein
MNGYQVWKIHRAVKMHFTSKNYDLFQYQGKFVRDDVASFQRVRRKMIYEMISSKFEKPYNAVEYFVSNIIYTTSDEALTVSAWDNHAKWIRQKESLTKLISDDLDMIDLEADLIGDDLPNLLRLIVAGKIMPQTACAIDANIPFLQTWKKKSYFGFDETVLKLTKLPKFCKYNQDRIASIIADKQPTSIGMNYES